MFSSISSTRKLTPSSVFLTTARYRTFTASHTLQNTTAHINRTKEDGAATETQDVTTMDTLLRATRAKASHAHSHLFPIRSRGKWSDALRLSRSPQHTIPPTTSVSSTPNSPSHPHLTPRSMADSYCELILPFHSSSDLLEAYTNTAGGIRTGKLMEHLDSIAGSIAYKHMLGPVDSVGSIADLGFYIVTASVDRLDMLAPLYPVRDLRLSGQVIHVGRSSMEIAVRMEMLPLDGTIKEEQTVMLGRFCMVCRDSKTHKARPVNPLIIETEEDKKLDWLGEVHKNRRTKHADQSLARVPPSSEEAAALHALYLQSTVNSANDNSSLSGRKKGGIERVAIGDTRLEKTLMMYPQERNVHQKIFGGYLMRLAYELGYTNSMLFTKGPVHFLSLDSIAFAKPVPIGSVLHLTSHILHTENSEQYPSLTHVGVKATVIDVKTGSEELTNDFRFTWCREEGEPVGRTVVPMTYQEAMWWIEGKRALDLGAEIRDIRQKQRHDS